MVSICSDKEQHMQEECPPLNSEEMSIINILYLHIATMMNNKRECIPKQLVRCELPCANHEDR